MSKKSKPKLLVVFDTNVLFTQAASDLVRGDVQKIIQENSSHTDIAIEWFLPEVVIGERKYQMLGKAKDLIPNLLKLEKLIGHSFGINHSTLELHVDKIISDNMQNLSLKKAGINTSEIDWKSLIDRSINRNPPFEPGEKEKGFRDSIIAHTFLQLHKASPTTPSVCRLALVSEDKKLCEYVDHLTKEAKNIRILSTLDELESLINTLTSTLSEELALALTQKATLLFFEKENQKSLYYKEMLQTRIKQDFPDIFGNTIIPGHFREAGTWWISPPVFIKKERQRIYWTSTIEPEFEIFHYDLTKPTEIQSKGFLSGALHASLAELPAASPLKKIVDRKGRDKFEISWTTNLSSAQNLTTPKIEKISYVGNDLND